MTIDPVIVAALVAPSATHRAAALRQAQQGAKVIPCHVLTPSGCSCGDHRCPAPGAHALIALERATSDPERVGRWWTIWGGAAVGVVVNGRLERVLADPSTSRHPAPAILGSEAPVVVHRLGLAAVVAP